MISRNKDAEIEKARIISCNKDAEIKISWVISRNKDAEIEKARVNLLNKDVEIKIGRATCNPRNKHAKNTKQLDFFFILLNIKKKYLFYRPCNNHDNMIYWNVN